MPELFGGFQQEQEFVSGLRVPEGHVVIIPVGADIRDCGQGCTYIPDFNECDHVKAKKKTRRVEKKV